MAVCSAHPNQPTTITNPGSTKVVLNVPNTGRLHSVILSWTHVLNTDLSFALRTPAGSDYRLLWSNLGGSSGGGSLMLADGRPPLTSRDLEERLAGPFGRADGEDIIPGGLFTLIPSGEWILTLTDAMSGADGSLTAYSVCLHVVQPSPPPSPPPPPPSLPPMPSCPPPNEVIF